MKSMSPQDLYLRESAMLEYLVDWLRMLLRLVSAMRLKYSISSTSLRQVEAQLASLSHQMEAQCLSLSLMARHASKVTDERLMTRSDVWPPYWIQLTIDEYLDILLRADLHTE